MAKKNESQSGATVEERLERLEEAVDEVKQGVDTVLRALAEIPDVSRAQVIPQVVRPPEISKLFKEDPVAYQREMERRAKLEKEKKG